MAGHGLVIGKFLPPHRGHKLLIDTALAESDRVTVIVCDQPGDPIAAALRAAWLREIHPTVDVLVVEDRYDPEDSRLWAELTVGWLGGAPDTVFTSEDYGVRYARLMGSRHVLVDRARMRVPCSGTAVRADPFLMWDYLEPCVRAHFARRVCVLGAESTGTTTLAAALAERFRTAWVEEYGREYSVGKMAHGESEWRTPEFLDIQDEQSRREEEAARRADRLLVCDTNAFATILWHRRYVGRDDPEVTRRGSAARCDLYLLTGDEIPFVQDGLRDGEHVRHAMHGWFEEALRVQPVPWRLLPGRHEERLAQASEAIEALFSGSAWHPAQRTK